MKILVCGGRDYTNCDRVWATLDSWRASNGELTIIEGGATGADRLAQNWALDRKQKVLTFHADWKSLGRSAGPIRNRRMLNEGKPDLVLAFPGGRGTRGMVEMARAAGVDVVEIAS